MDLNDKNTDHNYLAAVKRVDQIKGFYTHLMVYLGVNIMISGVNIWLNHQVTDLESFWQALGHFSTYSTWLFWGLGLLIHGLNVFWLRGTVFKKWEERKLKEFIEDDINQRKRYE